MTKKQNTFWFWFIAFIITVTAVIYQRKTGPTYPKRLKVMVNDSVYNVKMVRSLSLDDRPVVKLKIADSSIQAKLYFRKFPTNDTFQVVCFQYEEKKIHSFVMNKIFGIYNENGFYAAIPPQPAAGKIQYYLEITDKNGTKEYFKDIPMVIRFKGAVPASILIPHIFIMFLAMFFSNLAGLMAVGKRLRYKFYAVLTMILLITGGLILGPLVQKYAFGDLWTGVPFGWDLTDNKTLICLIFWIIAVIKLRKEYSPLWVIVAALVMLVIYSIPHSMFGSELNYETGKVITGCIGLLK